MTLDARIADLEKEVADLKTRLESASSSGTGETKPDQAVIDEAVRTAVSKRETELQAEHQSALAASSSAPSDEAIKSAVAAKEAELTSSFETRLSEAKASNTTEGGDSKLKEEVEALTTKLKAAERLVKTAEISRKTLERTKETLETKLAALEGKSAPTPTPATPTPTGPAGNATTPGAAVAATVVTTPAGPSTGAVRGTATRGRGRGAAIRGGAAPRGGAAKNPVLNGKSNFDSELIISCQRYSIPDYTYIPNLAETPCTRRWRDWRNEYYTHYSC